MTLFPPPGGPVERFAWITGNEKPSLVKPAVGEYVTVRFEAVAVTISFATFSSTWSRFNEKVPPVGRVACDSA